MILYFCCYDAVATNSKLLAQNASSYGDRNGFHDYGSMDG